MAASAQEAVPMSPREQLAEAHKRMSPEAIAEHALALADALEQTTIAYNLSVGLCRQNLREAKAAVSLTHSVQRATRQAANFAAQGQLIRAVDAIRELAAIEMIDPAMIKGDEANYVEIEHEPEMFSPKEPA